MGAKTLPLILTLLLGWALPAAAAEVPPAALAKLVLATLAADRGLVDESNPPLRVVIVGKSTAVDQLQSAFQSFADKKVSGRDLKISVERSAGYDWQPADAAFDVAVFAERLAGAAAATSDKLHAKKIRSVAAFADDVEQGLLFGFAVQDNGRPQLVVNKKAADALGARFAGNLLKFARFVESL